MPPSNGITSAAVLCNVSGKVKQIPQFHLNMVSENTFLLIYLIYFSNLTILETKKKGLGSILGMDMQVIRCQSNQSPPPSPNF